MRAVAIADDRSVSLIEVAPPGLKPGEVRVAVRYVGICGSDLHMLHIESVPAGLVLGHEFSGVLSEVSADVASEWSVGDRVTVLPIDPCGQCRACLEGEGICMAGLAAGPGLGRQGAYAETVVVPAVMLRRLPDSVSDLGGAVAEPLAVAIRGIERSEATPQTPLCVLGAGPIGFMTAVALKAKGFHHVIVVDPNPSRQAQVGELGFPTCSAQDAPDTVAQVLGGPPRVIIDCTGHPSGVPLALSLLPSSGVLVVVGVPSVPISTDFSAVAVKELVIKGSLAYNNENFAEALEHLAAGRVPLDRVVTSVSDLSKAWELFQDLVSGSSQHVKVLLKP